MDCKLAAPVGFCRGCGPRFRVHLSRHACSLLICGFFRCFRLFGVFFEANWFLTLIAFDKKDNAAWSESLQITSSQSTCIRDDFFAIARF